MLSRAMPTHTIIAPSKTEWERLEKVKGNDFALASVAADCILAAAGVPPYCLSADDLNVPPYANALRARIMPRVEPVFKNGDVIPDDELPVG